MICFFLGEKKCGENLYMSSNPTSWSHVIQSWFDEKDDFTYGVGPKYPDAVVGHYTQVRERSEKTSCCNALKRKPLKILTDFNIESGGRSQVGKGQPSHFVGSSTVSCHLSKACKLLVGKHIPYFLSHLNG